MRLILSLSVLVACTSFVSIVAQVLAQATAEETDPIKFLRGSYWRDGDKESEKLGFSSGTERDENGDDGFIIVKSESILEDQTPKSYLYKIISTNAKENSVTISVTPQMVTGANKPEKQEWIFSKTGQYAIVRILVPAVVGPELDLYYVKVREKKKPTR